MNLKKKIEEKGFYLIAEIGNNHEGNLSLAKKMIAKAHEAGADAIKLQFIVPETFISKENENRFKYLKKVCFNRNQVIKLYKFAKKKKIEIFSSIFDHNYLNFFSKKQKIFKIASGDNDLEIYYKNISKFKKTTLISTGLTEKEDIKKIYKYIDKYWSKKFSNENICVMHCVSDYPTKKKDLNLNYIKKIPIKYIKGFSDHSVGINACSIAFTLGAKVIEKHFTLNKKDKFSRDHALSADPKDLKKLVKNLNSLKIILGNGEKKLTVGEKKKL